MERNASDRKRLAIQNHKEAKVSDDPLVRDEINDGGHTQLQLRNIVRGSHHAVLIQRSFQRLPTCMKPQ
eukprot:1183481-Prorocentrum_minimum.AAC.4